MTEEWSFLTLENMAVPILVGLDPNHRIGQGAQGTVYQIEYIQQKEARRLATELLLKVYDGIQHPDQQERMKLCCRHLDLHKGLRTGPLLGLPYSPVVSSTGEVAVFMNKVPGRELGEPGAGDKMLQSNLAERLHYAWQLAEAIAQLHSANILHADITLPNIMVDLNRHAFYIIDVDGGGILAPGGFAIALAPVARYKETEPDVLPPELYRDIQLLPNVACDNWALAVIIFRILTSHLLPGGLTPFQIYESEQLRLLYGVDSTMPWPSLADIGPYWSTKQGAQPSLFEELMLQIDALGEPVKNLFSVTFGMGRLAPNLRSKSRLWRDRLDEARRWVAECTCGKDFVAAGRSQCPWCRSIIPHPLWKMLTPTRPEVLIEQDQQIMPGIWLERTERGTYIARSQQLDTTVNGARQTHEMRSGKHVLTVVKSDRPAPWRGELIIP